MSVDPMGNGSIKIISTDYASANLNTRIKRFKEMNRYVEIEDMVLCVQFLRGAAGRASFILPALYMQLGSRLDLSPGAQPSDIVNKASVEYLSLVNISLICRSVFDDSRKGMSGKRIACISDATLAKVTQFWCEQAKRDVAESTKALKLLRELFKRCARPEKELIDSPSLLERRVGLLKFHANRQAAHISLETYLFDVLDLIHVVAAITVLGAMIVSFDNPALGERYFDQVDEAGWRAAKAMFPHLTMKRIFDGFHIHQQAANYWRIEELDGLNMLLNQLPSAIGYWDSDPPE
jgi:hypothetical protein